jgi:hypothetical protein
LLSLMRFVPFFSGVKPLDSWRFDLTYFQNGFVLLLLSPPMMFVLT